MILNGDGREGAGDLKYFDVSLVEHWSQALGAGRFPTALQHVCGEVHPFDIMTSGEEGEEEASGSAAEFEGPTGVFGVEAAQEFQHGGGPRLLDFLSEDDDDRRGAEAGFLLVFGGGEDDVFLLEEGEFIQQLGLC